MIGHQIKFVLDVIDAKLAPLDAGGTSCGLAKDSNSHNNSPK